MTCMLLRPPLDGLRLTDIRLITRILIDINLTGDFNTSSTKPLFATVRWRSQDVDRILLELRRFSETMPTRIQSSFEDVSLVDFV